MKIAFFLLHLIAKDWLMGRRTVLGTCQDGFSLRQPNQEAVAFDLFLGAYVNRRFYRFAVGGAGVKSAWAVLGLRLGHADVRLARAAVD